MLHRLIVIFFILTIQATAYSSLDIAKNHESMNTTEYMYCIEDTNGSLSFENILHNSNLVNLKKSNFGYSQNKHYCILKLTNSSQQRKTVILSNPRSSIDYIDVNVYQKNKIQSFSLGDMRPLKNRSYPSFFSNVMLELEAKEDVLLLTKTSSIGPIELAWIAQSMPTFFNYDKTDTIIVSLYQGFLFSMMIYMFLMFFLLKDKLYLVYTFYIATAIITNAALQGSLHYLFNGYIDYFTMSLLNWNLLHINLALLWLFIFYFFKIKKASYYYYLIILLMYYNILIALFYSYAYIDSSILQYTNIIALTALIESIIMFILSIDMYLKKQHGSGYFLIAHILYIVVVIKYIFTLVGQFELTFFNRHLLEIAVFFMITFMSIALSSRLKGIKEENEKIKKQLEHNKRYIMIGTTISYISHQWKQPLSVLSTQVLNLLFHIEKNPNTPVSVIEEKVLKLEDSIMFINDTLNNIKNMFTTTTKDTEFLFLDVVSKIQENLQIQFEDLNINFKCTNAPYIKLHGNENLFIHVINNLVQNSIEAFELSQSDKYIDIKIKENSDNTFFIYIQDNAGGIKISPVESIFEPNVSNKDFGTGTGLALSKNILESKFHSSISVENTQDGALFKITGLQREKPKN